jgi:thiol-disulfide isomerase/thioredoxin
VRHAPLLLSRLTRNGPDGTSAVTPTTSGHPMFDDATGRLLVVVVLLTVASLAWLARRRRDGRFAVPAHDPHAGSDALTAADLGRALGSRATFVQFSAPTCASCPHVSRELGALAAAEPGVVHIEVPADRRLDLVRRLGVLRTPTVLLLGPEGSIRSRTSGPLDRRDAEAALIAHLEVAHV